MNALFVRSRCIYFVINNLGIYLAGCAAPATGDVESKQI